MPPLRGTDVDAAARALHRYLQDGQLGAHDRSRPIVRETWGTGKATLARKARRKAKLPDGWQYTPALDRVLINAGAFDQKANALRANWIAENTVPPPPAMVHPHPHGFVSSVCQGIHETAGLAGNMALDWCAQGETPVVAVVAAEIVKISGRNPASGADNTVGLFGWNIHYVSQGGYRWFSTHYGSYRVWVGQKVKAGDVIGSVGRWPGDPGRSHTHLGVTSPRGRADAIKLINRVAASPRVRLRV